MTAPGPTVVLGGAGYLGSALVRLLAGSGKPVRAVTRQAVALPDGVEAAVLDVTDPGALAAAVHDAGVVVHLLGHRDAAGGWRDERHLSSFLHHHLVRDLLTLLADRPGRVPATVLLGGSVASRHPGPAGYARDKLDGEGVLAQAVATGAVRGASLRLPTVYGVDDGPRTDPPRTHGIVAAMTRSALRGDPITVWDSGRPLRDLLHVTDAAHAFATAATHPERLRRTRYDLGAGTSLRVSEIAAVVAAQVQRLTGRSTAVLDVPAPPHATISDAVDVTVDPAPVATDLGWRARVDARSGIARTASVLWRAQRVGRGGGTA